MGSFQSFEDIEVWQKARLLSKRVYVLSQRQIFDKDRALRDQARRAVTSISLNIAEGFERGGNKEFMQFLSIAKGSAGEVRSLCYIMYDLNYLDELEFIELKKKAEEVSRMINGLIKYLKSTTIKGIKYKTKN